MRKFVEKEKVHEICLIKVLNMPESHFLPERQQEADASALETCQEAQRTAQCASSQSQLNQPSRDPARQLARATSVCPTGDPKRLTVLQLSEPLAC